MSARAIRRLREKQRENEEYDKDAESTSDEDDVDEDDVAGSSRPPVSSFAAMMMDDSDSESDDDSDDDDDDDDDDSSSNDSGEKKHRSGSSIPNKEDDDDAVVVDDEGKTSATNNKNKVVKHDSKKDEGFGGKDEEEDVDALIEEFREKDEIGDGGGTADERSKQGEESRFFQEIVAGLDPRELDVDYVMRTSLLGDNSKSEEEPAAAAATQQQSRGGRNTRNRQVFLFGAPQDDWVRPPHYVGGGIGMTTYERDLEERSRVTTIPWPYDNNTNHDNTKNWFRFVHSDTIRRECNDFRLVRQSGDVHALVLFVARHPYLTEALLQLSSMLYQTNRGQEGLLFLRRCLWVYECSSSMDFCSASSPSSGRDCFMDYRHPENATYFRALFRLARVNNIAGMPRASLAISRFLLSLDPLRDPTGILMALDHYALASNVTAHDQWLVSLVECRKIKIYYRDDDGKSTDHSDNDNDDSDERCCCDLLDLPNWSYSYALALFRLQQQQQKQNHDDNNNTANDFLRLAMRRFPAVVGQLLRANDIDTGSRSFQRDWPSVIEYIGRRSSFLDHAWSSETADDAVDAVRAATSEASELIARIFVKQNHKLWAGNDVQQWLFDNLRVLNSNGNDDSLDFCRQGLEEDNNHKSSTPLLFSPAIRRYRQCDPSDYESRFDLLPPEANPLDPGLLAHAMAVDPNRRGRFLRG